MVQKQNKKPSKKSVLTLIIVLATLLYAFAFICFFHPGFNSDDYVFGWLSAFSQALLVLAFFRFDIVKEKLRTKKITEHTIGYFLIFNAVVVAVGVVFQLILITQIGSAMVLLGINALVSYLDYEMNESEAKDRRTQKNQRKREARHRKKL